MSRRVTVSVPGTLSSDGDVRTTPERLTASFALDASRARVVERGGTLAASTAAPEDDPTLAAFRSACAHAGRELPPATRIRVVSQIAVDTGRGGDIAARVAGVVGARVLLDLPLDDSTVVEIVARLDGGDGRRARAALGEHTAVVYTVCDDA